MNFRLLSTIQKQKGKIRNGTQQIAKTKKSNNEQMKNQVLRQASYALWKE